MKYQEFENGLSSKFQNATENVDTEVLLVNLHNGKPKKKRKILLWFFFGISTLTLGYAGMNYLSTIPIQKGLQKTEIDTQNNDIIDLENKVSDAELPQEVVTSAIVNKSEIKENSLINSNPPVQQQDQILLTVKNGTSQVDIDSKNNTSATPTLSSSRSQELPVIVSIEEDLNYTNLQVDNQVETTLQETAILDDKLFAPLERLPFDAKPLLHSLELNPDFVICPSFKKT